jgi:hypothetical protein
MAKAAGGKPAPVSITTTVTPGRGVPRLPSAAAHSDAARDHARLAAAHSARAAAMSRDEQRERPKSGRVR